MIDYCYIINGRKILIIVLFLENISSIKIFKKFVKKKCTFLTSFNFAFQLFILYEFDRQVIVVFRV